MIWAGGDNSMDRLRDAQVFVGGRFTAEMAAIAEKLRLVHVAGAGTDRVAFEALGADVLVANTFHHERSIAEFIMAAAIMLRRGLLKQDRALRSGVWASSVYDDTDRPAADADAEPGSVSSGSAHIGQHELEDVERLGLRGGRGHRIGTGRPRRGLAWAGDVSRLDDLSRESDVLVVSAPLTPTDHGHDRPQPAQRTGTRRCADQRRARPTGRRERPVRRAAAPAASGRRHRRLVPLPGRRERHRRVCAPSELPFAELPNVLMTPHRSGVTADTFQGRSDDIAANIGRLLRNEPLCNVVQPSRS